jgi:acetyl esterase
MALDEPTVALLAQLGESGAQPLHEMTPEQARGLGPALAEMYGAGPGMARVEDVLVSTPDGPVPVRVLVPHDTCDGVLVYYHGGGWVVGAVAEFDTLARILARRTRCAVVLVEYRLAPEHRHPAAVDDAWSVLRWAAQHRLEIAGTDVPLIVAGRQPGGDHDPTRA